MRSYSGPMSFSTPNSDSSWETMDHSSQDLRDQTKQADSKPLAMLLCRHLLSVDLLQLYFHVLSSHKRAHSCLLSIGKRACA